MTGGIIILMPDTKRNVVVSEHILTTESTHQLMT